ncbi:oligosaccharide repeat unit polymerase [Aromatoleum diolicum]|uniref:Oligosaccharide repeat unit polymerase n=1 Tax=Aromatoleum diolicum TaxID=75796 RepID=A0ABX1Q782_9RHOO|nr:oligosaccharide repeat unit polymerase [Aromatoleum diolicum]NMG73935.1 oligosaccharide repeat unit polymerase [Aromatoleum diolicum]
MNGVIFLPSLYGFVAWFVTYLVYVASVLPWDPVGVEVHLLFILQIGMFLSSTVVFALLYRRAAAGRSRRVWVVPPAWMVFGLHVIGFAGIAKFVLDFSPYLENGFLSALMNDSSTIRALGSSMTSVGTQISYIGWLAIGISVCYKRPKKVLLAVSLFQLLANFVFIDRTRPVWIMFAALLCFMCTRERIDGLRVFRSFAVLGLGFVGIFVGIAVWSGKMGEGLFDSSVNPLVGSLYLYLTAGFAYFGHMLQVEPSPDYFFPERVFAPMLTVLHSLGLSGAPPSQILDFYEMPFPSNVGTALEPFYRDGGIIFVLFGILVHSFGFDFLGRWLLKSANAASVYAWATLCFCNVIGFFTPKIGNFPVWLFLVIGVGAAVVSMALRGSGGAR